MQEGAFSVPGLQQGGGVIIKIDKGIPIPRPVRKPKSAIRTALDAMQVGDSFAIPKSERIKLRDATKAAKFLNGYRRKFACRTDGEMMRVWLISSEELKHTSIGLAIRPDTWGNS